MIGHLHAHPAAAPSPATPAWARPGCWTCPNWSPRPGWSGPGRTASSAGSRPAREWAPPRTLRPYPSAAEVDALPVPPRGEWIYAWAWEDEAAGRVRARGFPGRDDGIEEDEATGAAALLLTDRLGRALNITQGRGSQILTAPQPHGWIEVGGAGPPGALSAYRRPGDERRPRPGGSRVCARRRAGTTGRDHPPPRRGAPCASDQSWPRPPSPPLSPRPARRRPAPTPTTPRTTTGPSAARSRRPPQLAGEPDRLGRRALQRLPALTDPGPLPQPARGPGRPGLTRSAGTRPGHRRPPCSARTPACTPRRPAASPGRPPLSGPAVRGSPA